MAILKDFLTTHPNIRYLRYHWVDYSGVLHAKVISKRRSLELAANDDRIALAQNCLIVPISTAPECFPSGPQRWELSPDWDSLQICGCKPNHAGVMCFLTQTEPPVEISFEKCPRRALSNVLKKLDSRIKVLVGFEIEFVLLDQNSNLKVDLDRITGFATMAGLRHEKLLLMEDICESLEHVGIPVQDFHTEIPDQLELVLGPSEPMKSIDYLMAAQETIRVVALKYGAKASMLPRPVFNGPQNGLHTHISLGLGTSDSDAFLQGVIQHMKSLCAFGMPNVDSYVRVMDDGAGCFIGWGTENRDLPIRKIKDRFEIRFVDATANLYLFLAALLSAGMDGMDKKLELKYKDCMEFSENLPPAKLAEFGMSEETPRTLLDTVKSAKENRGLRDWLGETLVHQYIEVKEKELEKFRHMSEEDRRQKFLMFF